MAYNGPRRTRAPHARDSQRQKVYNAEGALPNGQTFATVPEMQAYVDRVLVSGWARRRWGRRTIRVEPGFGHRNATGGMGVVQMPKWSRTERTLLHEMAHCLASAERWHDPTFVRVALELYEHELGKLAAIKFRRACKEERVKIGSPLKLRPADRVPPAPIVIVERLFRVEIKRRGKDAELHSIKARTAFGAFEKVWHQLPDRSTVNSFRVWLGREVKIDTQRAAKSRAKTR